MAFAGDLHAFGGNGINVDRAVVVNVDFAAGFLHQPFDVLAARADERADLLRIDFDLDNARGVLAQFGTRRGDGLRHLSKDVEAGDRAFSRVSAIKLCGKAAQLEVQLEPGNAVGGAGDLAIHVAEGVFPADDVGEEFVGGDFAPGVVFGADADADAADGTGQGHAGIHQGEGARRRRWPWNWSHWTP